MRVESVEGELIFAKLAWDRFLLADFLVGFNLFLFIFMVTVLALDLKVNLLIYE